MADGTITGATYVTPGKVGNYALSFDGGDDVTITTPASFDLQEKATLSFWVKFDTLSPANSFPEIFNSAGTGIGKAGIVVGLIKSSGKMFFEVWAAGNKVIDSQTTKDDWATGTWFHIGIVWDSGLGSDNVKWYIDGDAENTTTDTSTPDNVNGTTLIGDNWEGDIDDFRLYSEALSASQISDLSSFRDLTTNLVSKYEFEEGSGSVAFDTGSLGTVTVSTNGGFKVVSSTRASLNVAILDVIRVVEQQKLSGSKVRFDTTYDEANSGFTVIASIPTGSGVPNA